MLSSSTTRRCLSVSVRRFCTCGPIAIAVAALCLASAGTVLADTFEFTPVGTSTDWNDPNNWTDLNTMTTGTLPGTGDTADVDNGLTATITGTLTNPLMNRIYIGPDGQNRNPPGTASTGSGTLNQTAGTLSTGAGGGNGWFRLGQSVGNSGDTGTYNMSGTADLESPNDTIRVGENGTGIMTMTGNSVLNSGPAGGLVVADNGHGTFTISGNAVANIHDLHVADGSNGVGVMNIHGGTINNPNGDANIGQGGHGTVNQDGGTINFQTDNNNWTAIGRDGGTGVYNLSGGTVTSQNWLMVGRGSITTSGTFNISGTGTVATRSFWIGQDHSTGVVNQTGGTVNVGPLYAGGANDNGNFRVGFDNGQGTYNISGGVLDDLSGTVYSAVTMKSQLQSMDINDGNGSAPLASGTFNQTGGTVNANWVRNGNGGGIAQYNISGTVASPSVLNAARIMAGTAGNGNGTYNQTTANTTVNVDNDVSIGDTGLGVYNLSAGTLNAGLTSPYSEGGNAMHGGTATGNEVIQMGWSGPGTFNQTGGTVNALNTPITAPDPNIVQGTVISGIGFNGNNTASGAGVYNLSGGVLNVAAIFKVNDGGTGTFNFNGGTLRVNGAPTTALPIFMGAGNPDIVNNNPTLATPPGPAVHTHIEALTASNVMAGGAIIDLNSFGITISQPLLHGGTGTDGGLTLLDSSVGGGSSLTLTGADTFNGPTNITANPAGGPTLFVGNPLALQNSTVNITKSNSVLFTSGLGSATFGALAGSGNLALADIATPTPAAVNLTAGGNNSTTAYSGVLSGGGGFTKAGTGAMTLSTSQTYTGPTIVSGGTLMLSTGISLASSGVTVGGAAATPGSNPTISGSATITNGLIVNGSGGTGAAGIVAPGGASIGTLNVGSLTLNGGSILNYKFGAPGTSDLIASVGALTLPGAGTGSVLVNLTDTGGFGTGTYKIITESSTSNFTNTTFSIAVGISGFQEGFVKNPAGTEIDLVVTPAPTWSATPTDTNWANPANWVAGLVPGVHDGTTTNTDLAAFTNASTILTPMPDLNRNLQNITFDLAGTGAYVIGTTGGNALLLTTGGKIQTTVRVANTETINAPLVLEGVSGSYTFSSNAANTANVLIIGGGVTGVSTATNNTVLNLTGTNNGANAVNGVIGNGSAGGTLGLAKTGAGVWVLGGSNTFTGGVDVEQGTLRVGNAGALNSTTPSAVTFGPVSTGTLALNGNSITISGLNSTSATAQVVNANATPATLTVNTLAASSYAGVLADGAGGGALSLIVSDAGLTLSGNNTFTGDTNVIGAATLTLGSTNALQDSTLNMTVANNVLFAPSVGAFTLGGLKGSANLALQDTGAAAVAVSVGNNGGSTTYSGVLSGPGSLNKIGAGTLTLTNANLYTGTTTITGGTLQLGDGSTHNGSVASPGIINNAVLAFANPNPQTYSGTISGTGAVTKTAGAGTLTLTGNNTFSGGTTVGSGATLIAGPSPGSPLGTGSVTLQGATLNLQGQLMPGLTVNLYNNSPNNGNQNGPDLDYQNAGPPVTESYTAMTTHFSNIAGTLAVSTLTSTGGKANLNFSNNNYGGPNAMFNTAGPTNALYGFSSTTNFETYFTGYINIGAAGSYTFSTTSDDGSDLFVDGSGPAGSPADTAVVANNAFQGSTTHTGTVTLTSGLHKLDIGYYQGGGGEGLLVQYSGPDTGGSTVAIPNTVLAPTTGPLALGAFQTYANNLVVTATSTVNIVNSLTATLGGLSIGAATLNVASPDTTNTAYSLTFAGPTTLTGNATINVANSASAGAGQVNLTTVGGAFSLTKTGPGVLSLSGNGTYSGGTILAASTGLVIGNNPGSLGTGPVTLNNATTLRVVSTSPIVTNPTLSGFGGTSTSVTGAGTPWTVNNAGIASNPINSNVLTLTDGVNGEQRSAFFGTKQSVAGNFAIGFTYTATGSGTLADGTAVIFQNDPRGLTALGGGGGGLAYSGITPSAAYEINVYPPNTVGSGVNVNGNIGPFSATGSINQGSGDPINVALVYNATAQTLTEVLTDTVTGNTFANTHALPSDLVTLLGGPTAFFGFSGATGGSNSTQLISNFSIGPGIASVYANNVVLPGGSSATIDVGQTAAGATVTMGSLTVGSGAGTTLNLTNTTGQVLVGGYGVNFTGGVFNGNLAINNALGSSSGDPGTVTVSGVSTFATGVAITVNSGTLGFNNTTGAATVNSGVSITVAPGANLVLAGSVSDLSSTASAASRVHVVNNGNLVVSGTHQQTGGIDQAASATGVTTVNGGSDLTADHIVQSALIIGGDATHTASVTIAASTSTGGPMASGLTLAGSLTGDAPFGAGLGSSTPLAPGSSSPGSSLGGSVGGVGAGSSLSSVPEPSSIVLIVLGSLACLLPALRRGKMLRSR